MTIYEIIPGKSIGNITLGMTRNEARGLLGDYREFSSNSVVNMNTLDHFSLCTLGYDAHNKVEFISIHSFDDIAIKLNDKILTDMVGLELFSFVKQLDPAVELEYGGVSFESNFLGFAAYFEIEPVLNLSTEEETLCGILKAMTVTVKDYWKKYSNA